MATGTFADMIREKLCHGFESIVLEPGPSLRCRACNDVPVPNVYDLIRSVKEKEHACTLAEAYHAWSGDVNVPIDFVFLDVKGILDTRVEGQTWLTLRETVHLLKAVNAPFVQGSEPPSFPDRVMENFLPKYLETIARHRNCGVDLSSTDKIMLDQLIGNMHQLLVSKEFPNLFQYYFEKLVPYVSACKENWTPLHVSSSSARNLYEELKVQFEISSKIRDEFGIYSIPFDVVHVMIGCYASSCNLEVVANWALDLMARVCNGRYFWKNAPNKFSDFVRRVCEKDITYKKRTDFYYVIKEIRKGNGIDCLSSSLQQYAKLEKFVQERMAQNFPSAEAADFVANQLFPNVLFDDVARQVGFNLALAHVAGRIDGRTGLVKKGTFAQAKSIHDVAGRFIERLQKFDNIPLWWTLQTFQMFLAHDETIEKDIEQLTRLVFEKEKPDNKGE